MEIVPIDDDFATEAKLKSSAIAFSIPGMYTGVKRAPAPTRLSA